MHASPARIEPADHTHPAPELGLVRGSSAVSSPGWLRAVSTSPRFKSYLALAATWSVMMLLVNPMGDFPLNDDWSYGHAVQSLVAHGTLRFTGWTSMPLVVQVLWGALFCLPFGFSFTALRLSTLTLGLAGVFATYELIREAGGRREVAMGGALLLAVNPIYFGLSHSFMTDVPFTAFALLAVLGYARALRTGGISGIVFGTLFALMATLVRQLGVLLPVAFGLALLAMRGRSVRALAIAIVPVVVVATALWAYTAWLSATHGLPALYSTKSDLLLQNLVGGSLRQKAALAARMAIGVIDVGLFVFPLAVLATRCARSGSTPLTRRIAWCVGLVVPLAMLALLAMRHAHAPVLGNVLNETGIGPPTLRDTYVLKLPHLAVAPGWLVNVLVTVGVAGSGLAALALGRSVMSADERSNPNHGLLLMTLIAAALTLVIVGLARLFDRYLVLIVPLTMVGLATLLAHASPDARWRRIGLASGAAFIVALGVFSVAATHDYLAWNRARWHAADRLLTLRAVLPNRVDGGFEFNGWFNYSSRVRVPSAGSDAPEASARKSWWWVKDDEYVLAFGAIRGYREVERIAYSRWLPPGEGHVVVLRRMSSHRGA